MSAAIPWFVTINGFRGDPKAVLKVLIVVLGLVVLAVVAKLLGADFK